MERSTFDRPGCCELQLVTPEWAAFIVDVDAIDAEEDDGGSDGVVPVVEGVVFRTSLVVTAAFVDLPCVDVLVVHSCVWWRELHLVQHFSDDGLRG